MLDPRLLRVTITLDGDPHVYEKLAIVAKGSKFTSSVGNSCQIRIANIDKPTRDRLLTEGTTEAQLKPLKNTLTIEAGRESTGFHQVYRGDITTVSGSQAPDIWLTMRSLTGKQLKYETGTLSQNATAKFSLIASQVAEKLGVPLSFSAPDKDVANFSFSGSLDKMIGALGDISYAVDAYLDDDVLVVKPRYEPDSSDFVEVNINTGLVGIPEFVGLGVRCKVILTSEIRVGQRVRVSSLAYPAVDGDYVVYRLDFDLANRELPFYYILEGSKFSLPTAA